MIRVRHTSGPTAVCFGVVHPFVSPPPLTSATPHCQTSDLCAPGGPIPPDTPAIPSRASQLLQTSPSGTDNLFTAWILMGLPWVMGRTFLSVCSLSSEFLSLLTPNSLGMQKPSVTFCCHAGYIQLPQNIAFIKINQSDTFQSLTCS